MSPSGVSAGVTAPVACVSIAPEISNKLRCDLARGVHRRRTDRPTRRPRSEAVFLLHNSGGGGGEAHSFPRTTAPLCSGHEMGEAAAHIHSLAARPRILRALPIQLTPARCADRANIAAASNAIASHHLLAADAADAALQTSQSDANAVRAASNALDAYLAHLESLAWGVIENAAPDVESPPPPPRVLYRAPDVFRLLSSCSSSSCAHSLKVSRAPTSTRVFVLSDPASRRRRSRAPPRSGPRPRCSGRRRASVALGRALASSRVAYLHLHAMTAVTALIAVVAFMAAPHCQPSHLW